MKRTFQLLIVYIIFVPFVYSQKQLSIDDAVIGIYRKLMMESYKLYQFREPTSKITFVEKNTISEYKDAGKSSEIISLSEINAVIKNNGFAEMQYISDYKWLSENALLMYAPDGLFVFDVKQKKLLTFSLYEKDSENHDYCQENKVVAFTVENNLFLKKNDGSIVEITKDENKGIVNGKSVHRQEFGINNGIFWSPKGNLLAFYRMDETMVTDYPLIDINSRIAEVSNTKYPMAGMKSHHVTVGVFDLKNNKSVFLKTGEPAEQYLTNISWSPDEKTIYIAVVNREQNHMKLNSYDAASGDFRKTLFEEKHEKYVEPMTPLSFLNNNSNQFIYQSQRDGYNHLYLYDSEGKLIRQLTKGKFVVKKLLCISNTNDYILVEATSEKREIETHVLKVMINTGEVIQITQKSGSHSAIVNKSATQLIDTYSAIDVPMEYYQIDISSKKEKLLFKASDPTKDYSLGKQEVFTIKAADNKTDLWCTTITPPDFNPEKKYPLILYVYGGPHAQMIEDTWKGGQDFWKFFMAQKGYVVMVVDNRGSANRGFEFESVIHRNLGMAEMADQMKGIEYMLAKPYIDKNRIGVHGWSYGGFMTTSLMVDHSDIFKVGVAGGPVMDWKYYEIMYGERYMDTPEENPEGYEKTSLLNKASKLKGKLLLIHGGIDPTVVIQHSMQFVQKCIENKVQVDYFIYPNAEHNVRGMDRVHLMQKVTQYFDDYLMK
jgi:dipeptidyl-peptidase 4